MTVPDEVLKGCSNKRIFPPFLPPPPLPAPVSYTRSKWCWRYTRRWPAEHFSWISMRGWGIFNNTCGKAQCSLYFQVLKGFIWFHKTREEHSLGVKDFNFEGSWDLSVQETESICKKTPGVSCKRVQLKNFKYRNETVKGQEDGWEAGGAMQASTYTVGRTVQYLHGLYRAL